jgi:hypothetical protein
MTLRMFHVAAALLLQPVYCVPVAAQGQGPQDQVRQETAASIGTASMDEDGTIVLRLVAREPGGPIGHGVLRYPRTHPQYADILSHVGPLRPGETRPVRPWPD